MILLCLLGLSAATAGDLEVRMDPNVELLQIVSRLAGYEEFIEEVPESDFLAAVDAHFGPHADHPAVRTARRLRERDGISYNAPASLAVALDADQALRVSLSALGGGESRWHPRRTARYLRQLRRFRADADFDGFWRAQAGSIAAIEQQYADFYEAQDLIGFFDTMFGPVAGATYAVHPSVLAGYNSYGASVVPAEGPLEFRPVMGVVGREVAALEFQVMDYYLVVHEIGHAYFNPMVVAEEAALESGSTAVFAAERQTMQSFAYTNWQTVAGETGTRAATQLFARDRFDAETVAYWASLDHDQGFHWVSGVADALQAWRDTHAPGDMAGFGEPWNAAMTAWAEAPVRPGDGPAPAQAAPPE